MPVEIACHQCQKPFEVVPARKKTAKFCSYACRGAWRRDNWKGENTSNWDSNAIRRKPCAYCGEEFESGKRRPSVFAKVQFCSFECQMAGQYRRTGSDHPGWKGGARRKTNRRGPHASWVRKVLSRDKATCQRCGVNGVEMHAHHIKSYAEHPELRFDVDNGVTLCFRCHWEEHYGAMEKAVNSGDTLTDNAEGNPEPSSERKFIEGVTTSGRAYRKWFGQCDWCGDFIVKSWSDAKGKKNLFCSYKCSGLHRANTRTYRPAKNPKTPPKAVISATSAARESDDIVWTHGKP